MNTFIQAGAFIRQNMVINVTPERAIQCDLVNPRKVICALHFFREIDCKQLVKCCYGNITAAESSKLCAWKVSDDHL